MDYQTQQPTHAEPCSAEPRIFIGQVPATATFEDIYELFGKYGSLKEKQNPGNEGRKPNKGYAMIFYESWTAAELAVESENGKTPFGGTRPLIVKIAQPAKAKDGTTMPGIAPKKLFIGQISSQTSDDEIRNLFGQYGTVTEYHRLQKGGRSSDCVFVGLSRWSECEVAIEALNNQPSSFDPTKRLTVKFANMQSRDNFRENSRDNYRDNYRDNVRDNNQDKFRYSRYENTRNNRPQYQDEQRGYGRGNYRENYRENTSQRYPRPQQRRQQIAQLPNSIYPAPTSVYLPHQEPQYEQQHSQQYEQYPPQYQQYPPQRQTGYELEAHQQVPSSTLGNKRPLPGNPKELQTKRGAIMGPVDGLAPQYPHQQQPPPYSATVGEPQYYDQYGMEEYSVEPQTSQDYGIVEPQNGYMQQYPEYDESYQQLTGTQYNTGSDASRLNGQDSRQQTDPYDRYTQQQGYDFQQQEQYPGQYSLQTSVPPQETIQPYAPQDSYSLQQQADYQAQFKEWKLFVGQVPPDVNEYSLWSEFSKVGDIVDVAILRTQDGKSKACAFVTYVDRQLAEIAIKTFNMRLPFPNSQRPLTVKFAKQ